MQSGVDDGVMCRNVPGRCHDPAVISEPVYGSVIRLVPFGGQDYQSGPVVATL